MRKKIELQTDRGFKKPFAMKNKQKSFAYFSWQKGS